MIKAALLDLDNTLIYNPDYQFAIAFIKLLNEHFQKSLQISNISEYFRKGIQQLNHHRDSRMTNSQMMVEVLAQETHILSEQIQETLSRFYQNVYPQLKPHIKPNPIARNLIKALLKQNISIIIATQPFYPKEAVLQRLVWGNLSDYIENFALITHSDNMHSTKPAHTYYKEIINITQIDPLGAIMVGDSIENDIVPAQSIGLHTYHITEIRTLKNFYESVHIHNWQNLLSP